LPSHCNQLNTSECYRERVLTPQRKMQTQLLCLGTPGTPGLPHRTPRRQALVPLRFYLTWLPTAFPGEVRTAAPKLRGEAAEQPRRVAPPLSAGKLQLTPPPVAPALLKCGDRAAAATAVYRPDCHHLPPLPNKTLRTNRKQHSSKYKGIFSSCLKCKLTSSEIAKSFPIKNRT
jgi:hypothetical protein